MKHNSLTTEKNFQLKKIRSLAITVRVWKELPQIEAKIVSDKTNLPMLSKERNIDEQTITTHIKEVTYGPQGDKVIK